MDPALPIAATIFAVVAHKLQGEKPARQILSRHRFQLIPEAASALQAAELAEKGGPTRARLQSGVKLSEGSGV